MNAMLRYSERRTVRLMLAAAIFGVVAVTMRSIFPIWPLRAADVVIFVNHSAPQNRALVEVRKFIGHDSETTIYYNRFIYQDGHPENFLQLAGGNFKTMHGEFPLMLSVRLPEFITGRWCSQMTLAWQPSFSQREFHQNTPPVCFEVSDYE